MESIIERAFIQVLQDTLNQTPTRVSDKLIEGYLSNIDIVFNEGLQNTVTFVSSKEFLKSLGFGLFGENVTDDLELRDLSQELANLTMGLAKVLAIKENKRFNIKTPNVYGYGEFQDARCHYLSFALNGAQCSLFMSL